MVKSQYNKERRGIIEKAVSAALSTGPYLKYYQPLCMLRSSMAGCRSNPQLLLHDCFYKGNNLCTVGGWTSRQCHWGGFFTKKRDQNHNPTFLTT